jgi:uncharacterized protein GlcG (DUF336 family)
MRLPDPGNLREARHFIRSATMALTLKKAVECIEKGIAKARELGFDVTIAVVDEGGHLVAAHRMDGAYWVTPEIARAKANAAAAFRATTMDLEERFVKRPLFAGNVAALGDYQFVFGKGAVPIVEGGKIIGAIGVSGAVPAEHDHAIADFAAGHPVLPKTH